MKNTIISIIIMIALTAGIVGEIVIGVDMFKNKNIKDTQDLINYASVQGKANISIAPLFNFPDAPEPNSDGDVVAIDNNRFKINGTVTDTSNTTLGYIYYATLDNQESRLLTYQNKTSNLIEFKTALDSYLSGLPDDLVDMLPVSTQAENLTYYQQNHINGVIPIIYDDGSKEYYMFLNCGTSYYVLHAPDVFYVTDEKLTVHYPSPKEDPMRSHEFSTWEVGAIANTREQLTNGEFSGTPVSKGNATSSSDTYTSADDEDIRDMLVAYGRYNWKEDGTSTETRMKVDIVSTEAKASQWVLTETAYTYSTAGLTINGLYAKRTPTSFSIEGDIKNNIDASRPWVMCIKFMNREGGLLGLKVLDNRNMRLGASETSRFSCNLGSAEGVDLDSIYAIQFEVR